MGRERSRRRVKIEKTLRWCAQHPTSSRRRHPNVSPSAGETVLILGCRNPCPKCIASIKPALALMLWERPVSCSCAVEVMVGGVVTERPPSRSSSLNQASLPRFVRNNDCRPIVLKSAASKHNQLGPSSLV